MINDRDRTPLGRVAALTMRTQRTHPQLTGERLIRLIEPETDDLVEHLCFRILDQFDIPHSKKSQWTGDEVDEN